MRYLGYDPWNADGSLTQRAIGRTAASLTAVTITTSANRNTVVPSPFTGQLVFLTDTKKVQVWDGSTWLNITLAPPEPPTSLSATALSTTSISVAFTAGGANGSPITNYKYALSTNGGSSYGSFTALDPADATSPITISGLTAATTYHIKLKAVNDMGDSVESSATSVSTLAVPDAPTGLSASNATPTTVDISFTAGANNGFAITNYQYALSTDGGSTYGSFTALNPADATSPITITGLTHSTTYHVKLKAVNSGGAGPESAAVSFATLLLVDFLVIASGGTNGGGEFASAGGAGGLRSSFSQTGGGCSPEASLSLILNTQYAVSLGGDATFATVTSLRGGNGTSNRGTGGGSGGSGGGGGDFGGPGGSGTACQGYGGGTGQNDYPHPNADGGASGGAGGPGSGSTNAGAGVYNNITGTSVYYAPGRTTFSGSSGHYGSGNGGSPLVVVRYSSSRTITLGAGLTGSTTTVSSDKVTTITGGSGNVSWS